VQFGMSMSRPDLQHKLLVDLDEACQWSEGFWSLTCGRLSIIVDRELGPCSHLWRDLGSGPSVASVASSSALSCLGSVCL